MDLQEKLTEVSTVMRDTKTNWVATDPEVTDLGIYLHFWRGDEMVVALLCELDRDAALRAGEMAAAGFNADIISISFEAYSTQLKESPLTGKPWEHMEMQFVFETEPDAFEKGWVAECITTSIHARDGSYALHSQPYRINGTEVEYSERVGNAISGGTSEDGDEGGGFMHEWLQHTMAAKKLADIVADEDRIEGVAIGLIGESMTEEERLVHFDLATSAILIERELCTGVFYSAPAGSVRERMLKDRVDEKDLFIYSPEEEN